MIAQNFLLQNKDDLCLKSNPIEFDLLLCFGSKGMVENEIIQRHVQEKFISKNVIYCSTAGEIHDNDVLDNSLTITALKFDKTELKTNCVRIQDFENSQLAGAGLVNGLSKNDLKYVMVICDGALVNGSDLVTGMQLVLQDQVLITGGLAGNGSAFNSTLVGLNNAPMEGVIAAIGFYGDAIQISHGSLGGWEPFGLERTVTKSEANVLHEIDNKKALDLYKLYLGEYAEQLPGSALLFPLSLKMENSNDEVVRTILNIDQENQSMIFAGNLPEGSKVRFMKANFDKLIDAAGEAAQESLVPKLGSPKYALLISCVGRRLILDKRTEEEVEAVREIFGKDCVISGFYSYGEITPLNKKAECQLHNQTMTITTFDER